MFATWKALIAAIKYGVMYQEAVLKVAMLTPGKHRIEAIEAAVRASGLSPDALYQIVSAGDPLPEAFREALYGPQKGGGW